MFTILPSTVPTPNHTRHEWSFGDNYYWQMIANIRHYKGARSVPAASPAKPIAIPRDFSTTNLLHDEAAWTLLAHAIFNTQEFIHYR
jgi:hypothetical protein